MVRSKFGKTKKRKIVIIRIPALGFYGGLGIASLCYAIAAAFTQLSTITGNAVSLAVSLLAILTIWQARRQIREFRHEAKDRISELISLPTEDPAEIESDETGNLTRLPVRSVANRS